MSVIAPDEVDRIRETFLCALADKIHTEHNLPKRDALLVLTDSLLDDMNAGKL